MSDRPLAVAILGAGRLAEVMSSVLEASGTSRLSLWARRGDARAQFKANHPTIEVSEDIGSVTGPADVVIFAVPASAIDPVAEAYGPYARGDQVVVHACRGVGDGFRLPHQLIRGRTCVRRIVVVGGPLHSKELHTDRVMPAAVACRFDEGIQALRVLTKNTPVRIHATHDVVGVEVANAISNVSALISGMVESLGLGPTAGGLLLTRGLQEAQRLGLALGGEAATFAGVAGIGDLIPRQVSSRDRHHELGKKVAGGQRIDMLAADALEGVVTAREANIVAERLSLRLPLIRTVNAILRQEASPRDALEALLQLDLEELSAGGAKRATG